MAGMRRIALLSLGLLPALARAQVERLVERTDGAGLVVPGGNVATLQGPIALGLQPANVALSPGGLVWVHEDDEPARPNARRGDALSLSFGGLARDSRYSLALGLGVDWLRPRGDCSASAPCVTRSSVVLAGGTPRLGLGAAVRWLDATRGARLNGQTTFDLGATWRPRTALSLSLAGLNLDAPAGEPRRAVAGLGWRPFGTALTLGVSYDVDSQAGISAGRMGYLVATRLGAFDLFAQGAHVVREAPGGRDVALLVGLRLGLGFGSVTGAGAGLVSGPSDGLSGHSVVELSTARGPSAFAARKSREDLDLGHELRGPERLTVALGLPVPDRYLALVQRLDALAHDDRLDTLLVEIRDLGNLGLGRVEELRGRLAALRARGRKVVAFLPGAGDREYLLATAADRIVAAPQAVLDINGFASRKYFLRGLLDRLGVTPEFVWAGAYKSAPEMFTRTEASGPSREETGSMLDDTFARYVGTVAEARRMSPEALRALLDRGVLLSEEAVKVGLVDAVASRDALDAEVRTVAGRTLPKVALGPTPAPPVRWSADARVGVVLLSGTIDAGLATKVSKALAEARDDRDVKAVVLRIESPGGDVTASERLWLAVRGVAKSKPVIASMGDVAASGGYYVASAASRIVASPSTLTGSIGVFAGKADLSPLLTRWGVSTEVQTRGDKADLYSLARPWTEAERATVDTLVHDFYETFLQRVASGRNISVSQVRPIAEGRVWTGSQAKDRGLVDALGGWNEAVALAKAAARLVPEAPVSVAVDAPVDATGQTEAEALVGPVAPLLFRTGLLSREALTQARGMVEALADGRPMALALDLATTR
jgi:protease-4